MTLAARLPIDRKKALKAQLKTVYITMTFSFIGTLAPICAAPSAATAQSSRQSLSKMVAYSDLNLGRSGFNLHLPQPNIGVSTGVRQIKTRSGVT